MKPIKWLIALSLAAPLVAASAYADDRARLHDQQQELLRMDDLPRPVRMAVHREARDREVESIRRDFRDGHVFYSVEIIDHGRAQVLDISESGHVLARHWMHDERWEHEHDNH
jgi:hypothetical protein